MKRNRASGIKSRSCGVAVGYLSIERENKMSRVCQVTGKRPITGNNVSHANNKTRRRFLPNIHDHRFWLASEKRFVKLRVSAKGMRIIDKLGLEKVVADLKARGERV